MTFNTPLLNTLNEMQNANGERLLDVVINRLYNTGQSTIKEIAAILGVSIITVTVRIKKPRRGRTGEKDKENILALSSNGMTPKEIAYETGFSIHKVYRILRQARNFEG